MSDKAFLDTNLPISLVFQINSLHNKSLKVLKSYSDVYWSDFVKEEFKRRYTKKFNNNSKFFHDLRLQLNGPEQELYSSKDLINLLRKTIPEN